MTKRRRRSGARRVPALLLVAGLAGPVLVAVSPAAAAPIGKAPTLPPTFTRSVAAVPSFVASAGGPLSLTRQTVTGMAAQRYRLSPGMTPLQVAAVQAGFSASTAYPTVAPTDVVASAVGVLAAGHTTPVSSDAPGCSANVGGTASRVVVTRDASAYRVAVSGPQRGGFVPAGSWRLTAHGTERPLAVAVLEPSCGFDSSSAIAVTYPSGVDWYAYDGTGDAGWNPPAAGGLVAPAVTWQPSTGTVLASAHVNADASYLPVEVPDPESDSPDVGNATMLVASADSVGAVILHRLELTSLQPGSGSGFVSETGFDVRDGTGTPVTASLAYDNRGQGTIADASYALAIRADGANQVFFGEIGRSNPPSTRVIAQDGACAGTALPRLALATAPGVNGSPSTGVACAVATATGTSVQQWSDRTDDADDPSPPSFPTSTNPAVLATLPAMDDGTFRPFVTWPCVLLSAWGSEQQPRRRACGSDMATDLVGTPTGGVARYYQLPTLDGAGTLASREIAGATAGAPVVVDQLPLARSVLTVRNLARNGAAATSEPVPGTAATSEPVPVLYMMPAPMVRGLEQPRSGSAVSFGTSRGDGTGGSASFETSVGATVSATIGDPMIAQLQMTASAERATGVTDTNDTATVSTETINDNGNEAFVVYTTTPVWQWTGRVVADSTGIGTGTGEKVLTRIARPGAVATLDFGSVSALAVQDPAFASDGIYGPTLVSVFGPGVFGGAGRTVVDGDPGTYPRFASATNTVPRVDGAAYCDTHTGSQGVTSINSGVDSPYTEPDVTAEGPSYLAPSQPPATVKAGDSGSKLQQVTVTSSASTSYSTDFSVNASAGAVGLGVGVTLDAGFTIGNQTTVSTSSSQFFAAEIGNLKGASGSSLPPALRDSINQVLGATQTYSWEPFMCRRTTSLPGGGQTAALVLGFATSGFTGLPVVGVTGRPVAITGATAPGGAPVVAAGSKLQFTRSGPAAAYQVALRSTTSATTRTVTTAVVSPAVSTGSALRQSVALPSDLPAGTYSWTPTAISFAGTKKAGTPRYVTIG